MPLFYRRSSDSFWHLGTQESAGLDDEAARKHFHELRKHVEAGRGSARAEAGGTTNVFLPASCFDDTSTDAAGTDMRIIDLPGIGAENEHEREHVTTLAHRIVPHMDLIILAGSGNSLTFLSPEAIGLDALKNWQATPYRFRIVCTRVFSDSSTAERLLKHELTSTDAIRGFMMKQLRTLDFHIPSEMEAHLYAVEIGQSRHEMREKTPELHALASPLADTFLNELKHSIKQTTNPWFRLKYAYRSPAIIQSLRKQERSQWTKTRHSLREAAIDARGQIATYRGHDDRLKEEIKRIKSKRNGLKIFNLSSTPPEFPGNGITKDNVQKMRDLVDSSIEKIDEFHHKLIEEAQRHLPNSIIDKLKPPNTIEPFIKLLIKLDKYKIDSYWRQSSWETDKSDLRRAYECECTRHAREIANEISRRVEMSRARLQRKIENASARSKALQSKVVELELISKEKDRTYFESLENNRKLKAIAQRKILYGSRFMAHMRSAFDAELSRRGEIAKNEKNPARRFQALLILPLIEREYEKMKNGVTA